MPAPWTTYVGLVPPTCVVCCEGVVVIPLCALNVADVVNGPNTPFSTYDDAADQLDGTTRLAACFGWLSPVPTGIPSITFTSDTSTENVIVLNASYAHSVGPTEANRAGQTAPIELQGGSFLTVAWTFSSFDDPTGGSLIVVADKDFNFIDLFIIEAGSGSTAFGPLAAGQYNIICLATMALGASGFGTEVTLTSSLAMVPLQVLAKIDPAANVLNDEVRACPGFDLGLFDYGISFFPVAPFATKEDAETALASSNVSNCIVYNYDPDGLTDDFSATGSTDVTIDITTHGFMINSQPAAQTYLSVNLKAGATISVDWSNTNNGSVDGNSCCLFLYDRVGNFIGSVCSPSVAATSGTIDFTVTKQGEYSIFLFGFGNGNPTTVPPQTSTDFHWEVSSDMAMTVNFLAALYDHDPDLGLECFGRLICTPPP